MPTSTMQALRKMRPQRGAQLESVPIPTPGPVEALVRVRAASICGTDLHIYGWDRWSQSRIHPPLTFGHEFCGIVEKVGDEVTTVRPGEFVTAEMHVNCGHCRPCQMGQPHVCQNVRILGIDADGCFAEFVSIPARNIWKVDPAIPEHYAAIMDPLGNAVHTVLAGEIAGLNVLVTGAGPIGLMSIAVARAAGCATLFATEVNAHRRELAKKMGADEALDPSQGDVVQHVLDATDGAGVDVIFEGATVQGIYGRRMFETWVQMTEVLKHGRLNLEPLFKERMPLEKFDDAFSLLESGQAGKILFYPNGSAK